MELLAIGQFARLTGLTVRAVRQPSKQEHLELTGEPREIYWTSPDDVPPEEWLTEIQFPIVRDEARIAGSATAMGS